MGVLSEMEVDVTLCNESIYAVGNGLCAVPRLCSSSRNARDGVPYSLTLPLGELWNQFATPDSHPEMESLDEKGILVEHRA